MRLAFLMDGKKLSGRFYELKWTYSKSMTAPVAILAFERTDSGKRNFPPLFNYQFDDNSSCQIVILFVFHSTIHFFF